MDDCATVPIFLTHDYAAAFPAGCRRDRDATGQEARHPPLSLRLRIGHCVIGALREIAVVQQTTVGAPLQSNAAPSDPTTTSTVPTVAAMLKTGGESGHAVSIDSIENPALHGDAIGLLSGHGVAAAQPICGLTTGAVTTPPVQPPPTRMQTYVMSHAMGVEALSPHALLQWDLRKAALIGVRFDVLMAEACKPDAVRVVSEVATTAAPPGPPLVAATAEPRPDADPWRPSTAFDMGRCGYALNAVDVVVHTAPITRAIRRSRGTSATVAAATTTAWVPQPLGLVVSSSMPAPAGGCASASSHSAPHAQPAAARRTLKPPAASRKGIRAMAQICGGGAMGGAAAAFPYPSVGDNARGGGGSVVRRMAPPVVSSRQTALLASPVGTGCTDDARSTTELWLEVMSPPAKEAASSQRHGRFLVVATFAEDSPSAKQCQAAHVVLVPLGTCEGGAVVRLPNHREASAGLRRRVVAVEIALAGSSDSDGGDTVAVLRRYTSSAFGCS
jgi:hypothetical protein